MSWAGIAKKTPNHNKTTSIKVKYNVDSSSNKIKRKKDNIPRHKEIIPHVADDYIMTNGSGNWVEWKPHKWDGNWVDFEKYNQLQSHKQSLPFSIQLIIEFAQQRIGYNKLMKLNYNKLQKDLKHQYKKYNRDSTKLNKIYFDYPDGSEEYKSFNLMYFGNDKSLIQKQKGTTFEGMKNITLVHYLVNEIVYGNLVRNDPILIIMKLLIKNGIIDCGDVIHTTIWDGSKYTLFHMILYGAIQSKRHDQVTNNIEHFVDLIILCMRQQSDEIESLVRLYINKYKQALSHSLLGEFVHWMNFSYDPDEYHICNASQIIERLLFRGILPFQCINKLPFDEYHPYDYKLLPMNEMKQCLSELFDTFKINENINDAEKQINRRPFPKNQMALTAPLLILPYLNKAKHLMIEILVQCNHCSKEIANIICDYLYINYQIFYDKQLQNNLNVQCMIFFNHLAHFGMDTVFLNNFDAVYNNEKFINYLIDNYLFTLSCVLRELLLIDFDVIISLIQIYNNNKDKTEKFPLKEEKYGIYCILQVLLQHSSFDKYYQSFMKLLIYVKQVYEAEFDINFTYQFHYDGAGKYCEYYSSLSTRSRYNPHLPRTIMSMLLTQPSTTKTNVAKFILMEFKSDDDILIEFKNIKKRAKSF